MVRAEPEFLNFQGAQESIPKNQFRQAVKDGGPVRQLYSYSVPSPIDYVKNSSTGMHNTDFLKTFSTCM